MDTKVWYTSKALWGAVVAILASLLSLFHVNLDSTAQSSVVELLIQGATLIGAVVALYGRIKADSKLTLKKDDGSQGPSAPAIILLLSSAFALSACQSMEAVTPPAPKTPQQAVFLAESEYGVALHAALQYESLERCKEGGPKLCSDQAIVDRLRLARLAARSTLDAAESTVRNPAFSQDLLASAVIAATNAVAAFNKIQTELGVKP